METSPQTQSLTQLVFYSTNHRITGFWIFGEVAESIWWKIYLTMQVNRNVLFMFCFTPETQWTTLGGSLRDFKKKLSDLCYLKSKDFACNSTRPFAVVAAH